MNRITLADLNSSTSEPAKTGKKCVIEQIIELFPDENKEQVTSILENPEAYTAVAAIKVIRLTGITNGSLDSLKKHRRKECICYL